MQPVGKTIASLEAFIAGEPTPPAPKTNGDGKTNGRHAKPEEKPAAAKQDDNVVQFPQTDAGIAPYVKGLPAKQLELAREVGLERRGLDWWTMRMIQRLIRNGERSRPQERS